MHVRWPPASPALQASAGWREDQTGKYERDPAFKVLAERLWLCCALFALHGRRLLLLRRPLCRTAGCAAQGPSWRLLAWPPHAQGGFGSRSPMSTGECAAACLAAPGCEAFTVNEVQHGCFLKVWTIGCFV